MRVCPAGLPRGRRISCHRKTISYDMKTLREDRTAAEWKMSLTRPAAGGESCKAGFFHDNGKSVSIVSEKSVCAGRHRQGIRSERVRLKLPAGVIMIIDVLETNGYEAYAVGGCVRDSILGRTPDDWDITTSADPWQVKALFPRTVDTGLKHGTVTVLTGGNGYEVTTYRIDGEYEDGRHPKQVEFTSSLTEDLMRRDFTINAMAYSPREGLIDRFGGMQDLQRHVIRCVGDPRKRFGEDALRILRAVRFGAQLGFAIAPETEEAIRELAPTLKKISAERIQTELVKLLVSDRPEMMAVMWQLGITKVILPEFDRMMDTPQNTPHHRGSVGEHTVWALEQVERDKVLRLTMLLHDMGKPQARTTDETGRDHFKGHGEISRMTAEKILRRLKFDNDTIRKVTRLVQWHDYRVQPEPRAVRRAVCQVGEDLFPMLLKVQRADTLAQSEYRRAEKLARIDGVERIFREISEKGQCVSMKTLAVTGKDLIACGVQPGPRMGDILQILLEAVLDDPSLNTRQRLLEYWQEKCR